MVVLARRSTSDYGITLDVISRLPNLMRAARAGRSLTIEDQAAQVGVTAATLARLDNGSTPTQTTIVKCVRWLDT
jgi:transcriptional regulator with XRE-family HTH domain